MSYGLARSAVVLAVEKTAVSSRNQIGLGAGFRHDARGHEVQAVGASRRFWLATAEGAGFGPWRTLGNTQRVVMNLTVEYRHHDDTAALDVAIVEDATAIQHGLSNPSNWGAPSSTIRCLGATGDELFPFRVDDIDGGKRLRIVIDMEFQK